MALVTPGQLKANYDVIVVGSGAGGGQAAYTLTLEGIKVLLLEAGRNYVPETETPMFETPDQAPLRAAGTPDKPFGFHDSTIDGGWTVPGEPYTSASSDRGRKFEWWRARMLGGRTNHWGRYSFRNGQYDFKPRSRDGLGFDWPMDYADLAPYYDKVEMLIGVYGENDGLENTPDSPPGVLLPAPKPRVNDLLFRKHAGRLGIPVVAAHRAVLTKRLDADRLSAKLHPGNAFAQKHLRAAMEGRAACYWATDCGRGCAIRATYQSTTVHLPPAMASGNLDLVTNAMVREVTTGPDGRASGVIFFDKTTGREHRATGRVIVLAASSGETVRLMLNSKSARFPQGLANSSGLVGKYLMDTVGASLSGQIPALENLPPHNEDGAGGAHVYSPWWLYQEQLAGKLGFARGYHIEVAGGRRLPGMGTARGLEWLTGGSYGRKFKEDARRYYGSIMNFSGRGDMIPNEDSFCELDPTVKDKWGIPVLRFHWKWSEHEIRQAAHMQQTFADIVAAMGGRLQQAPEKNGAKAIANGGVIIHEVGGAIMGTAPGKSVTNQWSQTWDVPNLFLVDGAPFCSNADKNPTLTIMAQAWRAADHIVSELKQHNL
ncbi:MAG: GMC family oxidoreductase [Lacunisphaera sp.]|jgi:choline dehydrogenase-like flavoprotein|nr:GMC family oxidoreductase [Lacunisphaera sp.]